MANRLDIKTQGTISDWENDKADIQHAHLVRLADVLGIDPHKLGIEVPGAYASEAPRWFTDSMTDLHAKLDELLALTRPEPAP